MRHITITRPDDWHLHFRDGDALRRTVADTARVFARCVAMPNLLPPVFTVDQALAYRERILQHNQYAWFDPKIALYLSDNTSVDEIRKAAACPHVIGYKLYPAGATTHSDAGVTSIRKLYPLFEVMQTENVPLLIHGEITDQHADIFDREKLFIDQQLQPLIQTFTRLRIVLEHITTTDAVSFIEAASDKVAATITAHHLLFNRNHMLAGGIRPHFFCLPILKRNTHQQALIQAATSGNPRFFLGTDSAPHATHKKETACGCAGCYSAPAAIELYTQAFDEAKALDKLEAFASFNGADFYGLPRNQDIITLEQREWQVPERLPLAQDTITPLCAGDTLRWQLVSP